MSHKTTQHRSEKYRIYIEHVNIQALFSHNVCGIKYLLRFFFFIDFVRKISERPKIELPLTHVFNCIDEFIKSTSDYMLVENERKNTQKQTHRVLLLLLQEAIYSS